MSDVTLADWLLEQITGDEAAARRWWEDGGVQLPDGTWFDIKHRLAECEAKRRIVEMAQRFSAMPDDSGTDLVLDDVLRLLALPYADRPGYDESWRP